MKKQAVFVLLLVTFFGMTSCNLPVPNGNRQVDQEVSQQYSTVSALLTDTALGTRAPEQAGVDLELTPVVKGMSQIAASYTLTAATADLDQIEQTLEPPSGQVQSLPCDIAQPGRPIDITIPDDTHFYPGEYFSKTWRLVNAGDCVWTKGYALVWFSGDNLGLSHAQSFLSDVSPGNVVEVTVEMMAPQRPGSYQSNWKLRNEQGKLFGIGPNGDSPFWVRIVVVPVDTPTATPTLPIATPTPPVFTAGSLVLQLDEGADLDSGKINLAEGGDLFFIQSEESKFFMIPGNDVRIEIFGSDAPGFQECSQSALDNAPVDLQQVSDGSYFCYRTSQGLPGRIYLSKIDLEQSLIDFEFVTWVVP